MLWKPTADQVAQYAHAVTGFAFVLGGAFMGLGAWSWLIAIGFATVKEALDIPIEGAAWRDSLRDWGFYMAGIGAAFVLVVVRLATLDLK